MIVLTKADLRALCDTSDREKQIEQLAVWSIPFEITLRGGLKVLLSDVRFAGSQREGQPRYDQLA